MWSLYYSIQQKLVRYGSLFKRNMLKKTSGDRNHPKQQNLLNLCCSGHSFLVLCRRSSPKTTSSMSNYMAAKIKQLCEATVFMNDNLRVEELKPKHWTATQR